MGEMMLYLCFAGLLTSWLMLRLVLKFTTRRGLLAIPNERSSHQRPTPTLGGIALVVPILAFSFVAALANDMLARVILSGGMLLAVTGLLDDLKSLSSLFRILVQLVAAVLAWWLLGRPSLQLLSLPPETTEIVSAAAVVLAVVWSINLTNFMDGTDGLAASQCLFFCIGTLCLLGGAESEPDPFLMPMVVLLAALTGPFLVINWPPAKIFLGDVGSGFLGYLFAVVILELAWVDHALPFVPLLILLTVFWVDATYTLCVRMITGQAFTAAHRSHLYQILAQCHNHSRVLAIFWGFSMFWLAPLAWLSRQYSEWGLACLLLACFPVIVAGIQNKAGLGQQIRESDRAR